MLQPLDLRAADSVLVFAPHPDDETLGSGGLLQRARTVGARAHVVFATDGENNPWPQRVLERRWRIGEADRRRWGERRRQEARRALDRLGIGEESATFLSLPDQGITRLALTRPERLLAAIRREIATHEPTLVVAPSSRDHHPDHGALGLALQMAHAEAGETESDEPSGARPRLVTFLVHGRRAVAKERDRLVLHLTPGEQRRKRQAVLAHRSQLVFRGRFFLSFARETEEFAEASVATPVDLLHPIRESVVEGEWVRLHFRSRSFLRAAQPRRLLLLERRQIGFTIELGTRNGELEVRSAATGNVVGRARFRGSRSRGEILLPVSLFGGARSLFAKIDHPWSFFDEDGWREILASGTAGAATREPDDSVSLRVRAASR